MAGANPLFCRHMEDGCSKRFDIGTLDLRAEAFDSSMHPSARSMGPMAHHLIPPPGSLPPMAIPPLCSSSILGPMPSMRPREPLAGVDHGQGHSWGR